MEKKDWDKFFELVDKIVNEGKPVNEKTAKIVEMAKRNEQDATNFEEFSSWDFSLYYD